MIMIEDRIKLTKICFAFSDDKKNSYLDMNIVGYHICINLLINHIKRISSNKDNLF